MLYLQGSSSMTPDFKSEYLSDYNRLVSSASGFRSIRKEFENHLLNNNFEEAQKMASGMSDHERVLHQVGYLRDISEEMLYNHYN